MSLDKDNVWVLGNRGLIYQEMSDYKAALADFKHIIELDKQYNAAGIYRPAATNAVLL